MTHATSELANLRVALVHPAWHSCGTYRVVLGQIAAYRALGAQVWPIAISSDPGYVSGRDWIWKAFREATPELDDGPRHFGGAPFHAMLAPRFLKEVLWPYIHGDQARIRLGMVERAAIAPEVTQARFDLVHCNHFFLMPVARRLARATDAPILLDTHDLQARQFALINQRMPWLRPHVSYDAMLAQELDAMRGADLLLHLNAQESEDFRKLLPRQRHELLYPAVPEAPTGPGGDDIILVASNNTANVESVVWFLRDVAPRSAARVRIVGNVDEGVRSQAPELYRRCAGQFTGRIDDPGAAYARAKLVLLPTVGGTGLSIKSVEALSSGLPIIATTLAMRGMTTQALSLDGVTLADSPEDFAAALNAAVARPAPDAAARRASAGRRYYDQHFSLAAYQRNLAAAAGSLISPRIKP